MLRNRKIGGLKFRRQHPVGWFIRETSFLRFAFGGEAKMISRTIPIPPEADIGGLMPVIVDFYCHELKLVIELDGKIHELTDVKIKDKKRGKYLTIEGLQILRFTNDEVFESPETIIRKIKSLFFK